MTKASTHAAPYSRTRIGLGTALGVAGALLFFLITGAVTYSNMLALRADTAKVVHTHDVITELGNLLSATQDAETGQRGFLLTGDKRYLEPYQDAIARADASVVAIQSLTSDNPVQQLALRRLKPQLAARFAELRETIELRRTRGVSAALDVVTTDRGKVQMDALRAQIDAMRAEERRLRMGRLQQMDSAYSTAMLSGILAAILGIGLTLAVGFLVHRSTVARQRQDWLQAGEVGLGQAMLGDKTVHQLSDSILELPQQA